MVKDNFKKEIINEMVVGPIEDRVKELEIRIIQIETGIKQLRSIFPQEALIILLAARSHLSRTTIRTILSNLDGLINDLKIHYSDKKK